MAELIEKNVRELMPVFLGTPEGLPEVDIQRQIEFVQEYMSAGVAEFKLMYLAAAVLFKMLAVIIERRRWSSIDTEAREDVANRLFNMKSSLLRSIPLLLAAPLFVSYYRREDVKLALGFDVKALKNEANLRTVTRDRDLPPK